VGSIAPSKRGRCPGQLTDPSARKAVPELAESFDRLARAAATPAVLRRSELARERLGTKLVISPVRSSVKQQARLGRRSKRMGQPRGILTPEEQARIIELQDLLIERFVEQREAVAEGQEARVKTVEAEIDSLLREKKEIENGRL
jgi:hypothetical protein